MCGRYSLSFTREDIEAFLATFNSNLHLTPEFLLPRYNIAPGQSVLALIHDGQNLRVGPLHWGLISTISSPGQKNLFIINAKSESVDEKPLFRESFLQRRCLLLTDGFYEWDHSQDDHPPMRILQKDRSLFLMAGIWNKSLKSNGEKLFSCAILTTSANAVVRPLHERMPVIIDVPQVVNWLNPRFSDHQLLKKLCVPYPDDRLEFYPVSKRINNVKNDDPILIQRQ